MTAPVRTFLPWYRTGFATALSGAPVGGSSRAAVPVGIRLHGEPAASRIAVPLALAGPGDVVGLDVREVLRAEPFDGCADFEPSYFPFVELASPDLQVTGVFDSTTGTALRAWQKRSHLRQTGERIKDALLGRGRYRRY